MNWSLDIPQTVTTPKSLNYFGMVDDPQLYNPANFLGRKTSQLCICIYIYIVDLKMKAIDVERTQQKKTVFFRASGHNLNLHVH